MARSGVRWRWLVLSSLIGVSCELRSVPNMDSESASGAAGQSARLPRDRRTSEDELVRDDHSRIDPPIEGHAGSASKPGGSGASGGPDIREIHPEPAKMGAGGDGTSAADGGNSGSAGDVAADGGQPDRAGSSAAAGAGGSSDPSVVSQPSAAAGSGGAAGSELAGAGSAAAAGGGSPPAGLQCAKEQCAPLPHVPPEAAGRFSIANCCTLNGDCGTSINNGPCRFSPDSVPDCPLVQVRGFTIPTCCTSRGRCGIDFAAINDGCYSLDDVINWIGSVVNLPAPIDCEP